MKETIYQKLGLKVPAK